MKSTTVLLADDHAIIRDGLRALFQFEPDIKMVGEAKNGREAVEMAQTHHPDVILMDIAMPVLNGLEATRQILATNPAAKVIILSAHADDEYIEQTNVVGAAGFLEKKSSAEILTKAIHEVAQGKSFFSPEIAKRLCHMADVAGGQWGRPKKNGPVLTSREVEVLQLIAEGSANKQIAAELTISIKTVEKHRQHLMDKLNIHDTAGLTRYAITTGVIENSVQLTVT